MNNSVQAVNLADMFYDGSGGEYLARMLECFRLTITSALQTLLGGAGGTFTMDYASTTFNSWNALSSTPSTTTTLSKMDAATEWMRNNYTGLNLSFSSTSSSVVSVLFVDTNVNNGLVSRILNISRGGFEIASTAGTFGGTIYAASQPIFINFEGLHYVKVRCSTVMGFREAHVVLPGVQPTSLLSIVPSTGTPGSLEYYEPVSPFDRVTVKDFTMDQITLQFVDHLERPLTALPEFVVVITIDFMAREEEESSVNVMRH